MSLENLIGKEIEHKRYGKGVVLSVIPRSGKDKDKFNVRFATCEKLLQYPTAFSSGAALPPDGLTEEIKADTEKALQEESMEQEMNYTARETVNGAEVVDNGGEAILNDRRISLSGMTESEIKDLIKSKMLIHDFSVFYDMCEREINSKALEEGLPAERLSAYYCPDRQPLIGEEFLHVSTREKEVCGVTKSKQELLVGLSNGQYERVNDIRRLFLRLIFHSTNNARRRNMIKFEQYYRFLSSITDDFNVSYVVGTYGSNPGALQSVIANEYGKSNQTLTCFANAILTAARYLSGFSDYEDFITKHLAKGYQAMDAISEAVVNIGFAMACDFLKETDSRFDVAKPDAHITGYVYSFVDMEGFPKKDYLISLACKCLQEEINAATGKGISVYQLDKILYLIATKDFYLDFSIHPNTVANNRRRLKFVRKLIDAGVLMAKEEV